MRSFLAVAALLCGNALPLAAGEPAPRLERDVLFRSGTDGYHTYRIPGLVATTEGTLLAFCEGRKTDRGDHGDIDLLLKRSTDGGKTWSDQVVVHEEGDTAKITIGNPCPVVDEETGTVWLPFCRDNDRVLVTHSTDDGKTWAEPVEITATAKDPAWDWIATGPGHGIQLREGKHKGRLVVPTDCRIRTGKGSWNERGHSFAIYSDDHGKTWQHGELTAESMNECQVAERPDGSLLLSLRNYRGKNQRAFAVSKDGGITWSEPTNHAEVHCPTCQASLHRYAVGERDLLLYAGPGGPGRTDLTIRRSTDGGETWPTSRVVHEGPSAYSELAVLEDGTIVCLYEGGERSAYERIDVARFPLAWIAAGSE